MAEKMKPSGIGWIKDIPESWKTVKVKFLATEPETLFLDGDWIESDVIEESGIRYLTSGNVGAGFYKEQGSGHISGKTFCDLHCLKVLPGDLMISRLNEPIGRACIVPEGEPCYVVAVDNVILRPNKEYDRKFIMYAMNTDGYAEHGNMIARGATMSRVSRSQLGQFWLAFPNITEQRAIADFLDTQCAKIDSVIADIEKQIETLKQYKQSLIYETTVGGLKKEVTKRASDIDWISICIPEQWKTKKIRYLFQLRDERNYRPLEEVNLISLYTDLGVVQHSDLETTTGNKAYTADGYKKVYKDDIVVNIILCWMGAIGISDYEGVTSPAYDVYLPIDKKTVYPRYYHYLFKSERFHGKCYTVGRGIMAMRWRTYSSEFKNIDVPLPTYDEQVEIATFLDKKCKEIDAIIQTKQSQRDIIAQHKKALIYEYVTGKKRVTEVN